MAAGMRTLFAIGLLLSIVPSAFAGAPYDGLYEEYPKESYIVGIAEIPGTGDSFRDKRVAEVYARAEIARQIKVRLKEETVDIACEGTSGKILSSRECKNEFLMVIEQSVDEVLVGSKVVRSGVSGGVVYAVAVLPRAKAGAELDRNIGKSISSARESLRKVKEGEKDAIKDAKKEYAKAFAYSREREIIENTKSRSSDLLDELEKEIARLDGGQNAKEH